MRRAEQQATIGSLRGAAPARDSIGARAATPPFVTGIRLLLAVALAAGAAAPQDPAWLQELARIRAPAGVHAAAADFALTADGSYLIVARPNGVDAIAVDGADRNTVGGGRRWSLPLGAATRVAIAPTAQGAGFVAVTAEELVVADAKQERATRRVLLQQFGGPWREPDRVGISPRGDRVVVSMALPEAPFGEGRLLDLRAGAALPVPAARLGVFWPDDDSGVLLFDGWQCCSVRDAKWTWVPRRGEPSSWTVPMAMANTSLVPGRAEVVLATWDDLRRCDVRDGRVLAAVAADYVWSAAVVAGHVVDVRDEVGADAAQLELRRLDDLAVVARMPCPKTVFGLVAIACTAARAPRLAYAGDGEFVVAEVLPPANDRR